jgi:hypothetical protein
MVDHAGAFLLLIIEGETDLVYASNEGRRASGFGPAAEISVESDPTALSGPPKHDPGFVAHLFLQRFYRSGCSMLTTSGAGHRSAACAFHKSMRQVSVLLRTITKLDQY